VKLLICGLAFVLVPQLAFASEKPDWAFPVTEKDLPKPRIEGTQMRTVPGSPVAISRAAADDFFNAPDWRPELHPPMPKVVQYGNKDTQVRACGSCHLPTGNGHDESAYVAGLPVAYFMRQMADWKSGERKYGGIMVQIAKAASDAEVRAAAEYFASVKPRSWIRVVETDTVPRSFVGPGNKRLESPAGGSEPMGNRIIEGPRAAMVRARALIAVRSRPSRRTTRLLRDKDGALDGLARTPPSQPASAHESSGSVIGARVASPNRCWCGLVASS
jgi:cytochrome c553